ncbi:hypothetical protein [Echinimonas agarilytica]|uniref:hypothetical protein n=1 Tax=Echinimonas agarilytica TaxID=1215918 RepID=UPI00203BF069|nr:hypothetical protein [Echinimonas agarilytica]
MSNVFSIVRVELSLYEHRVLNTRIGSILWSSCESVSDWSDELGSSFKLGQAEFTATDNISNVTLTVVDIFAEDANFNTIAPQQVPEPSSGVLFALASLLLVGRLTKQSNS